MGEQASRSVVERARSGDADAFAELFRLHEQDVAGLCRRMLGSGPGSGAEDAAADVFLRARRGLDGVQPDRPFRPWLLAVAGHHCTDLLRRRRKEGQLFDASDLEVDGLADRGPSPLQQALRAEARAAARRAIDTLPDRYRAPLVLRYYAELDYAAISEILEISSAQVGTLLFRAKRKLRERLAQGPAQREGETP